MHTLHGKKECMIKTHVPAVLLLCTIVLSAQPYISNEGIPKDSSYTVYGYYQKELKKFPFITIAKASEHPQVTREYNVVYKKLGGRKLRLDIFYASDKEGGDSAGTLPMVLFIHGGGWRSGDKSFQHPLAIETAAKGYITASVEYRLSPEAKYPASVEDIMDAVIWLKKNAGKYGGNPAKFALSGCSSGGHLAAFCGVTSGVEKFKRIDAETGITADVQAVVDIDGVLDFTHPAESGKDTSDLYPSVGRLWLGETYKQNPALWVEASPLNYIGKGSPAFLFINSSIPRFHAGRDSAVQIFKKVDIFYKIHTISDTPHTFWLFNPWFKETVDTLMDFLQKVLN